MSHDTVFKHLKVSDPVFLSKGQESDVYDLRDGRVLKALRTVDEEAILNEKKLSTHSLKNRQQSAFLGFLRSGKWIVSIT